METSYTYEFLDSIWRILQADDAPLLLIETRKAETRLALFHVFDVIKKEFLILNLELNEKWWIGAEAIKKNCIYFHFYDGSQYANHKSILCFDLKTKNTRWKNDKIAFVGWYKNTIIASQKGILIQIDAFSGNIIAENISYKLDSIDASNILFFDSDMEQFDKIARFILKKTQKKAVKHIEYLEHKSYILISYYICDDNKYDNYFMLANAKNSSILLDIIIDTQLQGVGSELFTVFYDYIILCKNKQNLYFYAL